MALADHSFRMLSRPDHEPTADFSLYPESPNMFSSFQFNGQTPNNMDPAFAYPRYAEEVPMTTAFESTTMYAEAPQYPLLDSPEMRGAPSNYSTASGPSATSSAMGSPHSIHGHVVPQPEWTHGMAGHPAIVSYENFTPGSDYSSFQTSGMDDFTALEFTPAKPHGFVDPSILHPQFSVRPSSSSTLQHEVSTYPPPPAFPGSPSLSQISRSPRPMKQGSQSPYMNANAYYPYPPPAMRRESSVRSYGSPDGNYSGSDTRGEKGRCPHPECGKTFKDLKAHMLTHQTERPEKCPIVTCDYHTKGFARKYDKNRHTLTHYKGMMICGFCPGSGSAAEKSFNRADVFKRHLMSCHGVEQSPPNSRKKTSGAMNNKKLATYAPDATGKCSTCSAIFTNAQDFYEHLDDCVLRTVQQEEPSEAINAARLAEVELDEDVHETLRNNALPITTNMYSADEEEDDEEYDDENDDDFTLHSRSSRKGRGNRNPANGVQKSRGLTHSKGGVTLQTKGRKKRKDYPGSWGCPSTQMKMKKRVLCVFDGGRRLWKDDMMLDTDYEVRMKLNDDKAYVTDLDVQTMRRADAFHNADESEKGPWISDDLTGMDLEKLMEHE